ARVRRRLDRHPTPRLPGHADLCRSALRHRDPRPLLRKARLSARARRRRPRGPRRGAARARGDGGALGLPFRALRAAVCRLATGGVRGDGRSGQGDHRGDMAQPRVCPGSASTEAHRMNDLLGDPLPATPAMTDPLPWRVFRLNDCDWWFARSLEEAIADYKHQTGAGDEELEDARELTEEELDRLMFTDDPDDPLSATLHTFRDELRARIQLQGELEAEHGIPR